VVYPDYIPKERPSGYWKDKRNQKRFFDQLAIKWNIQHIEEWNHVTLKMVLKEGGYFVGYYYKYSLPKGNEVIILEILFYNN
jgi:hypothetical protein